MTINITVNANADPREIAAAVERVIDERNRRAAGGLETYFRKV